MFEPEELYIVHGTSLSRMRFYTTFRSEYDLVKKELFGELFVGVTCGREKHRLTWIAAIARMPASILEDFMSLQYERYDTSESRPKEYLVLFGWFMNIVINELTERTVFGD